MRCNNHEFIVILAYVNDIIITRSNEFALKSFINWKFHFKDLGPLKFFLGIEVTKYGKGIYLSQCKYTPKFLDETILLVAKPCLFPNRTKVEFSTSDGDLLFDPFNYRHLGQDLIYLTITCHDIVYLVHVLSQFMNAPCKTNLDVAIHVLCYLKSLPGQGILVPSNSSLQL